MRLRYNAPATLTFTLVCGVVLVLDQFLLPSLVEVWFTAPGRSAFSFARVSDYLRLFTHVIGHSGWNHLLSNFAFILLLGPILEEKHGSLRTIVMMTVTALVTGLLNAFLFDSGLLGASGIVFMMILLASFTNFRHGEIPLTFILVIALYMTQEILAAVSQPDQISQFTHIAGGICGSLFGFQRKPKQTS